MTYVPCFQSELEDTLHKLEIENARLEAALKHERQRVESLQKELTDSHQVKLVISEVSVISMRGKLSCSQNRGWNSFQKYSLQVK